MRIVMLGEISDHANGQVVLTKGALYLMHDATVMWLDVVAFAGHSPSTCGVLSGMIAGYKYVSAVFNLAAFIMFGRCFRFCYESNY